MECRGLETGRVRWGLVGSGQVSQVESIQVDSNRVESWSGVELSRVNSLQSILVDSSQVVECRGVQSTVDSSRVKSSPVESGGVEPSRVMDWSLVQCHGMESGQVGWVGVFLVGSGRVKSS